MTKNLRKWIEGIKYDFEIGNVVEAKDTFGTTECVVIVLCYVESRTLSTGTMRYIPYYKVVPTKTLIQTSPTVHIHPEGLRNGAILMVQDQNFKVSI